MTVVAGFVHEGRVWMASDSLGVNGWDQTFDAGPKVVRKVIGEGECLIGVSGDGVLLSLLRHDLELPTPAMTGDLDEWAFRVACAITDLCRESKPDVMHESGKAIAASMLLGAGGRLWMVATNQAWPVDRWAAIGSGDEYAMGVLAAVDEIDPGLGPQERLWLAVKAACRFDLHCGGDMHLEVLG